MKSLIDSIFINGKGLMCGLKSSINIKPAEKGSGITFVNKETLERIPANVDSVIDTFHSVTLGNKGFSIRVVEHLMAALAMAKVTDVDIIIIDGLELPACDGSALKFYDSLKNSNLSNTVEDVKYTIPSALYFTHKHTSIIALPADNFKVSYAVNFSNSEFEQKWYSWDSLLNSVDDIVNCRTFGYTKDLSKYQSMGLAMGVTIDNTIGINDNGSMTTDLRCSLEPVKHKVLDLIGDLYLSDVNPLNLNAHVIAIECGHFQHVELAKKLKQSVLKI